MPDNLTSNAAPPNVNGQKKWTVMVFMGADGVEGNEPLGKQALDDLNEMATVGSNGDFNIFAQVHGNGDPQRYHILANNKNGQPVPHGEQDLTSGKALTKFIEWAILTAKHRPDDYSMLVMWGHAYRFGIGHTQTRAGIDAIDFAELASVLREFQNRQRERLKKLGYDVVPKLDIVGFDACDLATIEMAIQLQEFADYLLASQIAIPLPGWPYDRILDRLKNPKGTTMGPAEFGTYVVRRFCEKYHAEEKSVSLTLLDLQWGPELFGLTEVLAMRLAMAMDQNRYEQDLVVDLFRRSQTEDEKPFVDVADLCVNLLRESGDVFVREAAASLGDLLLSPPRAIPQGGSAAGARKPFVAEHGRNTSKTARLHGVSLYAPHVAEDHEWETSSYWYKKFVFVQKTLWSGLVHALAQPR